MLVEVNEPQLDPLGTIQITTLAHESNRAALGATFPQGRLEDRPVEVSAYFAATRMSELVGDRKVGDRLRLLQ
jgi:hypothetical protein